MTYDHAFSAKQFYRLFLIARFQLQVVDISPIGFVANSPKYEQIDFSVPKMIEPYVIIVPWPKEESRIWASIRPFQPMVWLWLAVALFVLTPFLTFLSGFYLRFIGPIASMRHRPIINFADLLHNVSFLLSHITNQGTFFSKQQPKIKISFKTLLFLVGYHYKLRLKSRGSYIAVGVWCLMAVVLANAYAGTLFSFLSVSKLEQPINSLQELSKSKDVVLIVLKNVYFTDRLLVRN